MKLLKEDASLNTILSEALIYILLIMKILMI
jgi:hypothetical protein